MPATDIDEIGATSLMTATLRARESERPDRLVDDPQARALVAAAGAELPPTADAFAALMGEQLAVRTRFLDDVLLDAAGTRRQVVLLAAGMDGRADRLAWPADTCVFEVDRAPVLEFKRSVLGPGVAQHVAADLAGPWTDALQVHGFDPARPTAWLVEGLLYALDAEEADALLAAVTTVSAPGSSLAFDHVAAGPGLRAALRAITPSLETLWRGGPTDPGAWLHRGGWCPDVADLEDVARRYGRHAGFDGAARGWLGTAELHTRPASL